MRGFAFPFHILFVESLFHSYYHRVAGAAAPAASAVSGVKRIRESAPPQRAEGVGAASSAVASAESAAPAPQAATRSPGSGKLITSGTTVHGAGTKFSTELKVGDAIEVSHPVSLKPEVRVIKMVLSDTSCGVNAPFSADLVTASEFFVLRLPKRAADPAAIQVCPVFAACL